MSELLPASLTVGIAARNRPRVLAQGLASLALIERWIAAVIVVDDASDEDLQGACAATLQAFPEDFRRRFRFIRRSSRQGSIRARNAIVRAAATEAVLLLDDDAYLLPATRFQEAFTLFMGDERIVSVAFACCDPQGSRLPLYLQPSRADYPCLINAYIGYGHLLRRSAFLALGGYREMFDVYGEEKEFCLRAWDAGWQVVYCPEACVVHTHDLTGRDHTHGSGIIWRNSIYGSLLNEPWPLPLVKIPLLLRGLAAYQGTWRGRWGVSGVIKEVGRALPRLWRLRRPVRWRTIRDWHRRHRRIPRYEPAALGS